MSRQMQHEIGLSGPTKDEGKTMQRKTIRDQILSNLRRQTKAQTAQTDKNKASPTAERRQRTTTLYM